MIFFSIIVVPLRLELDDDLRVVRDLARDLRDARVRAGDTDLCSLLCMSSEKLSLMDPPCRDLRSWISSWNESWTELRRPCDLARLLRLVACEIEDPGEGDLAILSHSLTDLGASDSGAVTGASINRVSVTRASALLAQPPPGASSNLLSCSLYSLLFAKTSSIFSGPKAFSIKIVFSSWDYLAPHDPQRRHNHAYLFVERIPKLIQHFCMY